MGDKSMIEQMLAEICRITRALDVQPLGDKPGVWEHQINDDWRLSINPHDKAEARDDNIPLPPYHFLIEYCGFPFALFSAFDGIIGKGAVANDCNLIDALKKHADSLEVG